MKTILWVTGRPCAGKTHIMTWLERTWLSDKTRATCVYPGRMLRQIYGEKYFARQADSMAPRDTDTFVRTVVRGGIEKSSEDSLIVIDGVPRTVDQARWLIETFSQKEYYHIVLYLTCTHDTFQRRILLRSPISQVLAKRAPHNYLLDVFQFLREADINTIEYGNNSTWRDDSEGFTLRAAILSAQQRRGDGRV